MERQIVLKIKDGNTEKEYALKFQGNENEKWSQILEFLFNEDSLKMRDVIFRRIFASSTDEVLISTALGAYSGKLPFPYLERIFNRFPKSEEIQLSLALYCSAVDDKEFLKRISRHPATDRVAEEVKYILETS